MSCLACDLAEGRIDLPGGRIDETGRWLVEHSVGPLGLGTLIVKPKRHVLHVAELELDEAAELGPLLRRVAAAVTQLVRPEQVYICLWSHAGGAPNHIHFVVQPVTRSQMEAFGTHGPFLQTAQFTRNELQARDEVEAFSNRVRAVLSHAPSEAATEAGT